MCYTPYTSHHTCNPAKMPLPELLRCRKSTKKPATLRQSGMVRADQSWPRRRSRGQISVFSSTQVYKSRVSPRYMLLFAHNPLSSYSSNRSRRASSLYCASSICPAHFSRFSAPPDSKSFQSFAAALARSIVRNEMPLAPASCITRCCSPGPSAKRSERNRLASARMPPSAAKFLDV